MFSLHIPTEPYWLTLQMGVRVQVRPLGSAVISAATAYANRKMLDIVREHADRLAAGMPADDLPDVVDDDVRRGLVDELTAAGLARHGILDWEGVGAADGSDRPAPCTKDNAALFGRSALGLDFLVKYQRLQAEVAAEGNGSAPMPNGASGVGANTAAAAGLTAPNARDA
ncbi:hypothetical protein [Limobrevibacterium gyesilva]|uniref:Uncharacterized protein n=1 Tax=Limobrevibacterium gyesilva TaxID=2991712 RepID=A0AA42CG60_9PROT|nr:hypothetical protein [Limobrevibacterium gyesilva]MCW3477364.1 hypothetical protein [Limobrevibacterium gyesilva]